MRFMFNFCESLRNINLSNFNTQNVIDMSRMFGDCVLLRNINLSNFNTQNVTDMSWMFFGCNSLTNIDLSNFNTQNVTTIKHDAIRRRGYLLSADFFKKSKTYFPKLAIF